MTLYTKATVKASKEADFMAVASTSAEDRHGEVVSVDGWDIKAFQKNPVLLWAHDHSQPAVGHATKVWVEGTGKRAKLMIEGVINEATELSRAVKELVKGGVIKTMSVGFQAKEMEGNTFTEQELLEVSFVNVPANSQAMITAYKSLTDKGFSEDIIKSVGVANELAEELIEQREEIKQLRTEIKELTTPAKGATPESQGRLSVAEKRATHLKVIARATDQLIVGKTLPADKRATTLKVIKRATEKLIKDNKGEIHGKIERTT